jgi:hypothetical protein
MVVRLPAETAFETQPRQNNGGHRKGAVNQTG